MKIYIKDGIVNFYKYKIEGQDNYSRNITLYAKNDIEKDTLRLKLTLPTVTDISPTTVEQTRALDWQKSHKNYDVIDAEKFVSATAGQPDNDSVIGVTEVRVYSKTNPASKLTIDYNEEEGSIDFNID